MAIKRIHKIVSGARVMFDPRTIKQVEETRSHEDARSKAPKKKKEEDNG